MNRPKTLRLSANELYNRFCPSIFYSTIVFQQQDALSLGMFDFATHCKRCELRVCVGVNLAINLLAIPTS